MISVHPDYKYDAVVLEIHDGDTCKLDVALGMSTRRKDADFGFHVYSVSHKLRLHETFRFYGINAPELATQAGKDALAYLQTLIHIGMELSVQTFKGRQEKYGRWLATLYLSDGTNVNQAMVAAGHAVPYLV